MANLTSDDATRYLKEDTDMTGKNQLRRSGTRLQKQGTLWLEQTRKAGEVFVGESKAASSIFANDLGKAGRKLALECGRSTNGLRTGLRKEALDWQKLALQTRDAYVEALRQRVRGLEAQAQNTREALTPDAVEATVLESTRELLVKAQSTLDERIEKTQPPKKAAPKAKAKAAKPKAAKKKAATPIRNYDQLSAKDVVSRVQRLSGPQASAVLEYERAKKKRATVIRAVQKRLAVAS